VIREILEKMVRQARPVPKGLQEQRVPQEKKA
jgi:hypothetical protein